MTTIAALPTRRQTQAKRSALIERDGHLDFKGQRCSPCVQPVTSVTGFRSRGLVSFPDFPFSGARERRSRQGPQRAGSVIRPHTPPDMTKPRDGSSTSRGFG